MRKNVKNHSVSLVIASVAILAITVGGVLFSSLYSDEEAVDRGFDPNIYPSPAAGLPGKRMFARNCNDINYRTTKDGVKYVRLTGGGVLIGSEYKKKFGFYKIEYGILSPVERSSVDGFTREKLKYALYNCDGPFVLSGVGF